jgi:hypothetical protein
MAGDRRDCGRNGGGGDRRTGGGERGYISADESGGI